MIQGKNQVHVGSRYGKMVGRLLHEEVSDVQHQIWASWMKYLFSLCETQEDGTMIIPAESVVHWKRQIETEYSDLTHMEKESDREQANKVWERILAYRLDM